MAAQDRGYTLLLNHLHNPKTSLTLQTIQSALSHHLSTLSPSPTPLAATAISAPFFLAQPLTYQKLNALSTAFRHATHFKFRALSNEEKLSRGTLSALFRQTTQASVDQWARSVVKGLQGGHPVLRLASCSGLLLGVEDLEHANEEDGEEGVMFDVPGARGLVEDENIVGLAEVMDTYAFSIASGALGGVEEWEKEFQPAGQDVLSMALIFASQSFPLIPQNKLKALPLPILSQILTSTICATFKSGSFLSSVSASVTLTPENHVHIAPSSAFAQTIQSITSSPLSGSISSIARFTANVAALLLDSPSSSRLDENMRAVSDCLESLRDAAKTVERDWISTSLASVTDNEIAPDTKPLAKSVWAILKTLLFTIVMVSEAALSASIFIPPTTLPSGLRPSSLALHTLHTFSHLAFVISQFGGVSSVTKGFEELKKTFYLALDVLSAETGNRGATEAYVEQVCMALNSQRVEGNVAFRKAKEAYTLTSIEQLVPVLSENCIKNSVWGVCYPHLFDASHRETFESAHSTALAIFASYAQQQHHVQTSHATKENREEIVSSWLNRVRRRTSLTVRQLRDRAAGNEPAEMTPPTSTPPPPSSSSPPPPPPSMIQQPNSSNQPAPDFVYGLIPFYAQCLIQNSAKDKLTTPQLRLAYAALVRSACASAGSSDETFPLAWYCVQLLLDAITEVQNQSADGKGKSREIKADAEDNVERVHRLELALISSISSLPLLLLSRALTEILVILTPVAPESDHAISEGGERRRELVEALFGEILEGVGDREKGYAMRWWYQHRPALLGDSARHVLGSTGKGEEKLVSRL